MWHIILYLVGISQRHKKLFQRLHAVPICQIINQWGYVLHHIHPSSESTHLTYSKISTFRFWPTFCSYYIIQNDLRHNIYAFYFYIISKTFIMIHVFVNVYVVKYYHYDIGPFVLIANRTLNNGIALYYL